MAKVEFSARANWDDDFGTFSKRVEAAVEAAVVELVEEGADISRELAPEGNMSSPNTRPPGRLKRSIYTYRKSRFVGGWGSDEPHADAVEFGAGSHPIFGNPKLSFRATGGKDKRRTQSKRTGRFLKQYDYTGKIISPTYVNHPGNEAQPYLRPALEEIKARFVDTIKSYMP